MSDRQESGNRTRREIAEAALVALGSALVLGLLWLVSRAAPSATRDPFMREQEIVPTPTPTPEATPFATPAFRPRRKPRRQRRRRPRTPETSGAASP